VISVYDSREIQAVILALKVAGKDLRKEIYKRTRDQVLPEWREAIATEIGQGPNASLGARLVLKNTRVKMGQQEINLEAATRGTRTTSGGLIPSTHYFMAEFGANPRIANISGRRGGTTYNYKRKINTWSTGKVKNGRYAFKAAGDMGYRAVALWVASTVQIFTEAAKSPR
jgi:hypothetical protein